MALGDPFLFPRFPRHLRWKFTSREKGVKILSSLSLALVTGAGKGIGRDVCLLLHQCGASVVALSRTKEDLELLKEEIGCEIIVANLEDGI